jgi:hypothetical protein
VTGPTCAERTKPQPDQSQFLAPDFWSSLSESISGVREILEDSSDEHEDVSVNHADTHAGPGKIAPTDANLLFPGLQNHDLNPPDSSPAISGTLFELFRARVDTVYKVVHLPMLLSLIRAASSTGEQTTNILALEYSMYFMAICTIDDYEAEALGLSPRIFLLKFYQAAAERFLASSNLLSHPDLHALQALVIYIVSSCCTRVVARREVTHARSGSERVSTARPRGHWWHWRPELQQHCGLETKTL